MSKLTWDDLDNRIYETGVDRGVFYPENAPGVSWNGLILVEEVLPESSSSISYYDGQKYLNGATADSFSARIEAYTYPFEFEEYEGFVEHVSNQKRKSFGFCYRTMVNENDYKLHLVYNAIASPSVRNNQSVSDTIEIDLFSWVVNTAPIQFPGYRPTAHLIVDSRLTSDSVLQAIETVLYGSEETDATLPNPLDILEYFEAGAVLRIIDNGDGSWTAIGPEEVIQMLSVDEFQISWPSAIYLDSETYTISSL